MQQIRGSSLPDRIHVTLARWLEGTTKVQSCRRDEIINAINRHQSKNPQLQKEKGEEEWWNDNVKWCLFIHSFIHSGDLYSTSSRDHYSEVLSAQSTAKKKDFGEKFIRLP